MNDRQVRRRLQKILICPVTGGNLQPAEPAEFGQNLDQYRAGRLWDLPWSELSGWWVSEDRTRWYPEVAGIPVLTPETAFLARPEGGFEPVAVRLEMNPFLMHRQTDPEYYSRFAQAVFFKTEFALSHLKAEHEVIAEWFSSDGATLSVLKDRAGEEAGERLHLALDADFRALKTAAERGLTPVCADLRHPITARETIDFSYTNSLHHLGDETRATLGHIYRSLKPGGLLVGVESQGLLAKLTLALIGGLPYALLPYLLREVKTERGLLAAWLKRPLEERLAEAGIPARYVSVNRRTTHVLYTVSKPEGGPA